MPEDISSAMIASKAIQKGYDDENFTLNNQGWNITTTNSNILLQ